MSKNFGASLALILGMLLGVASMLAAWSFYGLFAAILNLLAMVAALLVIVSSQEITETKPNEKIERAKFRCTDCGWELNVNRPRGSCDWPKYCVRCGHPLKIIDGEED